MIGPDWKYIGNLVIVVVMFEAQLLATLLPQHKAYALISDTTEHFLSEHK